MNIPSLPFVFWIRWLFFPTNMLALYMLLHGETTIGGGFIAGVLTGLSLAIQKVTNIKQKRPINTSKLLHYGLIFVVIGGLIPLMSTHQSLLFWPKFELPLNLVFEIGIYLIVIGLSLETIEALKKQEQP